LPEVTRRNTPVSMAAVSDAIRAEWPRAFPSVPLTGRTLALLLALCDLETATGRKVYNYNLGNIVSTSEEQQWFGGYDSGNARRFRAWPSLFEGARAFAKQLMSTTRPEWRKALLGGDPVVFAQALGGVFGGHRYYEASVASYTNTFLQRWQAYKSLSQNVSSYPPMGSARPPSGAVNRGGGSPVLLLAITAVTIVAAFAFAGTK
jgi:hypothetical protein